ncbi:MAG: hypothetical protein E8D49_00725 [Nitrospira sp.]|nr:MAG: hypothetical protein E8D49_00725 [Nitrospira sp.]
MPLATEVRSARWQDWLANIANQSCGVPEQAVTPKPLTPRSTSREEKSLCRMVCVGIGVGHD